MQAQYSTKLGCTLPGPLTRSFVAGEGKDFEGRVRTRYFDWTCGSLRGYIQLVRPAIPELESGPLQHAVCGAVMENNPHSI